MALVVGGVLAVGVAGYLLGRDDAPPEPPRRTLALDPAPAAPLPSYAELAPRPSDSMPPRSRFDPDPAQGAPETPPQSLDPPRRAAEPDRLQERAREAGVGGWTRPATAVGAGHTDPEDLEAQPADARCTIPAGTPIPLQTRNRIVTEQGGVLLATVVRDVWDAGFTCRVVPAGSTVTMTVSATATRGQRRIAVTDPVITRPWPQADTLRPVDVGGAVGADATGAAGLPGRVDVPWAATGLLIAASTALDLATAALTDGGSLLGEILGRTADRPLDRAARAQLERLPVITLDPGAEILLLLAGPLSASPQR